jgi:hypothetical protein
MIDTRTKGQGGPLPATDLIKLGGHWAGRQARHEKRFAPIEERSQKETHYDRIGI